MNWLIKWGVKKWLVGIVNTALGDYRDNVDKGRRIVQAAIAKVELVIAFLKGVDAKLADGALDADEADAIVDEAVKAAKDLVA